MDAEQIDNNLLFLSLNLSDSEPDEAAAPNTSSASAPTSEYQPTREQRKAVSEEAFQALKQIYRPKVENGNLHTTIPSLIAQTQPAQPLPKPDCQSLLHAAEELYFFRHYEQAAAFLRRLLDPVEGVADRVDPETRRLLGRYLERCTARLEEQSRAGLEA